MKEESVDFHSQGARLSGLWRTPDSLSGRLRAVVQGPGWMGLKDARLYLRYHEALTAAGFGVLIFDYRGFGHSEGDPRRLSLRDQLEDLVCGVSYLCGRDDVDAELVGVFGSGGTGGGNAVLLAAADPRVRAAVSQLPVADGADWLRRMRSEDQWLAWLAGLEADRQERARSGHGRLVDPREEIMLPSAERRASSVKADVDRRVPSEVWLAAADEILDYRPIDAAARLQVPLLVIAVEGDATTPTDHAVQLYEAARGPRALIMQRDTSHYAAYERYGGVVAPRIVDWFDRHLRSGAVEVRSDDGRRDSIEWIEEA